MFPEKNLILPVGLSSTRDVRIGFHQPQKSGSGFNFLRLV